MNSKIKIDIYSPKDTYNLIDQKDSLSVLITGDFCLDNRIEKECLSTPAKLYGEFLPILKDKDLSITNLECPLTDSLDKITKTGPNIKSSPDSISILKDAQFDIVTLANNHILDFGEQGLFDTVNVCQKAGIKTVGVGKDKLDSQHPLIIEKKGKKIGIINVAEKEFSIATSTTGGANEFSVIDVFQQIESLKEQVDIILLIIHGGLEHYALPTPSLKKHCHFFASLGVNAIVCHHTHCVSPYEIINGVPIFYSLGNFIFDRPNCFHETWYEGMFITLQFDINNRCNHIGLFPYRQCEEILGLRSLTAIEKQKFEDNLFNNQSILTDNDQYLNHWRNHCDTLFKTYFTYLFFWSKVVRQVLKFPFVFKLVYSKVRLFLLLNMFQCRTHKEVTETLLKNQLGGFR